MQIRDLFNEVYLRAYRNGLPHIVFHMYRATLLGLIEVVPRQGIAESRTRICFCRTSETCSSSLRAFPTRPPSGSR